MQEENYESRIQYLEGKKELSDEDIATVIEFHHEYPDMNALKKYTEKKYRDLTKDEKQELIVSLLTDDEYLKYKNCFIAKSKLLYDSSETLIKETAALSRLNDLGYEVYLLPYAYARDSMNCYQKSADSITAGDFLEMKSVVSTGNRAGQSAFESARHQADNVFLSFENETAEEKIISNIYRSIGNLKNGNRLHGIENNFEGMIFLDFGKEQKTSLYQISKEGTVSKIKEATYEEFKKIKGTVYHSPQVEVDPTIEYGSLPKYKGASYGSPQVVANPMTEHGSSRDLNLPQSPEKSSGKDEVQTIIVDGKPRTLSNGLEEGFVNAVRRVDELIDAGRKLIAENSRLKKENAELHERLEKKQRKGRGIER